MLSLYFMGKVWIVATMMGGLTYHLCETVKEKNLFKYWQLIWIIPLVWWLPRGEESNIMYLRDSIACSIIVITFYCLPLLQKIFDWNKVKSIKKVSYSLFITHGLVNNLFSHYLVKHIRNAQIFQNTYITEWITFAIVLLVDLLIAGIVYYLVENKLYQKVNKILEKETNQ